MENLLARRRVLGASLAGTAVEFYDFYIYATAASLLFGPAFLSFGIENRSAALGLRELRGRLFRAPGRCRRVRAFRRSDRSQVHSGRIADADGWIHRGNRFPADLRRRWMGCAGAAVPVALRSGIWPWWGVGWRRAAGRRERPARLAWAVRHVSPTWCSCRIHLRQWLFPDPRLDA